MEEREASERKTDVFQKKLQELFSQLNVTLTGDFGQPTATSFDNLMARVRKYVEIRQRKLNKKYIGKIQLSLLSYGIHRVLSFKISE
jgi:hypothetical protein